MSKVYVWCRHDEDGVCQIAVTTKKDVDPQDYDPDGDYTTWDEEPAKVEIDK